MKKLIFILFLFQNILLFAQAEKGCGTKPLRSEWLKKYQQNPQSVDSRGGEMIFVPMTIHLLGNDNGSGFYNLSSFLDDLCILNKDFEQANIQFFLNAAPRYVKSTKWNNHKTFQEGADMFTENNVEETINSYFVADPAGNCGYDWPGTGIALAKGCMGKNNHTWAHEMGHELSLPHTFYGWEGSTYTTKDGAPQSINGIDVEYYLDSTKCKNAGDGFCDTEADYISNRWTCNADKKSGQVFKDPAGKAFQVRGDYFMSYSNDVCMATFSKEQIGAMRANLLSEKLGFLALQNPYLPLVGSAKMLFPKDSSEFTSKKVNFKWNSAKNATGYFLEVSRTSGFDTKDFSAVVQDTSIALDLDYKKYYWRVKAFNLGFSCVSIVEPKRIFRIVEATAANDVLKLNEFLVFPNPIANSPTINLQFDADFSENANLEITDLSGKILTTSKIQIVNGFNKFEIETPSASGFYLLNIRTKKGVKQEKIIINQGN